MKTVRIVGVALAISLPCGIAAANNDIANNDDGFVWIDANTRIKIKPVSTVNPAPTTAGGGTSAPEKVTPKKTGKKEKPPK